MPTAKRAELPGEVMASTADRDSAAAPSVGSEVRQLRRAKGMTLKALGKAAGISQSYLSVIERDAGNPSIEVLRSIAAALSVDVNWFFIPRRGAGPLERAHIVRAGSRRNLNLLYGSTETEIGYSDSLLSSSIGGRFYMGLAVYAPGSERPEEPMHVHGGEEHGVVIKGQLELTLGDEVILLSAGDSYSFDARIPHHGRNRTQEETLLVWAVSPVVIPRAVEQREDAKRPNSPRSARSPG